MKPQILVLLVAGLAQPGVKANTLLWSDNFDVADTTNFDGAPLDGRLSGTLAALPAPDNKVYLRASKAQQEILGNQLRMIGGGSGRVRFQSDAATAPTTYNWANTSTGPGTTILADGGLRVEFDFTSTDTTSDQWIAFAIGITNGNATGAEDGFRVNQGATDYGILFRNDGRTNRFRNGGDIGAGVPTTPVATPRHIVLDYGFNSFADGTPGRVRVTIDGVQVADDTFTWSGNGGELYMELETLITGSLIDNYMISTIPVIYTTSLSGTSFISGITPGSLIGTLSGSTFAKGPEASTFAFVAGEGDADNTLFVINGDRIEAGGSYDFTQDFDGAQYFIRVQGTGTVSGGTGEKEFVLTLIKDDDADKLPDEWELTFANDLTELSGLVSGPGPGAGTGDFDGDGIADLAEYNLSLGLYPTINPMLADTDEDGLKDNEELAGAGARPATNPILADTDKDGLSDGVESNTGTFVGAADSGTNPLFADTDADGARDGFEVARGSLPTLFSSRPVLPSNFALMALTDDASSGISSAKIYTHKISGGAAATVNGVAFDALTGGATPANFTWTSPAKNALVGNGAWVPASGGVTGSGLQGLLGSFAYGNGNPGDAQTYTLSGLTVGTNYELRLYIRQWDPGTLRPIDLVFNNGASVDQPYGALLEDRPGLILNNFNDQSAYYLSYTYVAQDTSLVVNANVHPSSPTASGSLHFYGLSNESPAQLVISLDDPSFISGIAPGGSVATLLSETLTLPTEATTYAFEAGTGDDDNAKFVIVGDQLQAGSYDFKQGFDGDQFFIRVKGTGLVSGFTQEKEFVLTLIKDDDADDLPDGWEWDIAGNLIDLNGLVTGPGPGAGSGDFDDDGLSDLEEYNLRLTYPGLSPLIADSDDDGLKDGAELNPIAPRPATSPIIADMDKDGLKDGAESNTGTFVDAADTGTNPLIADSDLDGERDGFEVEKGSLPTDFTSRPALPAAFELVRLTDDASSGISLAATYTHAMSGAGPATINGVVLEEVNPGLFPVDFDWTVSVGTRNEVNPINNGEWVPATGEVTGAGLLDLLGGFVHQSSGEPGAFQTYTLSGLTVGETYHLKVFYRPWAVTATSFRPIDLIFTNGATVEQPFGGLPIDRPGIVLNDDNIHGAFYLGYTYVAESTELVIEALVHESAMVASGSNHLYGLTNELMTDYSTWAASFGAGFTDSAPGSDPDGDGLTNHQEYAYGLDPTSGSSVNPISMPLSGDAFAYTRRAGSGLTYTVYYSTDLTNWTWDENADQAAGEPVNNVETVSVTLVDAAPVDGKLFVRVQAE
ncbi:MAG: hypothetical protein K9N23_13895 [Akkermansiaceae bacterium]|nr:hypothetical protein [Akkermansiaceae bacterium]